MVVQAVSTTSEPNADEIIHNEGFGALNIVNRPKFCLRYVCFRIARDAHVHW